MTRIWRKTKRSPAARRTIIPFLRSSLVVLKVILACNKINELRPPLANPVSNATHRIMARQGNHGQPLEQTIPPVVPIMVHIPMQEEVDPFVKQDIDDVQAVLEQVKAGPVVNRAK
jgi:hypothetical protein